MTKTGIVNINTEKYYFKFSDFLLTCHPIKDGISIDEFNSFFNAQENNQPDFIEGELAENKNRIMFEVHSQKSINLSGEITFMINSYLIYNNQYDFDYSSVSFFSPELDLFYDHKRVLEYNIENFKNGEAEISIVPFNNTNQTWNMRIKDRSYSTNLNIARYISFGTKAPLKLATEMRIDSCESIEFYELKDIVQYFINFMTFICNRKNITLDKVVLKTKGKGNRFLNIGEYFINDRLHNSKFKQQDLSERIIKFDRIKNRIESLSNYIASEKLYLRHIPNSAEEQNSLTVARIILITAGFEWHFANSRLNQDRVKNENNDQHELIDYLSTKVDETTGKSKKFYKSIRKIVSNYDLNLSGKITYALKEYNAIVDIFVSNLLSINDKESYQINDIAEDIQETRNDFAHGNLEKELKYDVVLGLIILEWILYVIVLDDNDYDIESIRQIINELFRRRLAI